MELYYTPACLIRQKKPKLQLIFLQTLIVGRQSFADKAAGKDSRPTIALFPMGEVKGQTNKSQLFKQPLRKSNADWIVDTPQGSMPTCSTLAH